MLVIVGEPGAGASRLALELARRAPRAWYPDPLRPALDAEGDAEGIDFDGQGRPVIVLDGPSLDEALTPLQTLLARALHPRLLVIVPVDDERAARVPLLAGGYPRGSIVVVGIEPRDVSPVDAPDALLPFALFGRVRTGRFADEEELRALGLVSAPSDGEVVCLAGERARRASVAAADLARLAELVPLDRVRALECLLRVRPDAALELLEALTPDHARELVDPMALAQRGIAVPPAIARMIASSAARLLATVEDGDDAAALLELLAREASREGEQQAAIERLQQAEARAVDPRRRARLLAALGVLTGDDAHFARALELARERKDGCLVAELLRRSAHGDDGLARAEESARLEAARGSLAGAAAAHMLGATFARAAEETERAIELARAAHDARLRIGDARGALRAAQLVVTLLTETSRADEAKTCAEDAIELAEAIADGSATGYLRWVLGALADRSADPRAAAEHYQRAISGYRESGAPVPERLLEAVRAAELADQGDRDPHAEPRVRLSLIPPR